MTAIKHSNFLWILSLFLACLEGSSAFSVNARTPVSSVATSTRSQLASPHNVPLQQSASSSNDWEEVEVEDEIDPTTNLELYLKKKFPEFFFLLSKNDQVLRQVIRRSETDDLKATLFVPNAQAFENLGANVLRQLEDERNLETVEKIVAYHIIPEEAVDYRQLRTEDYSRGRPKDGSRPALTIEGIQTLGGIVPVGRSKDGGLFGTGILAKEDPNGEPVVGPNNARIVNSYIIAGNTLVHEMDGFISPSLLWRYMDQLQIKLPGFA